MLALASLTPDNSSILPGTLSGTDMVLPATVRLSWTLFKSCMLMVASGWCVCLSLAFSSAGSTIFGGKGGGGGTSLFCSALRHSDVMFISDVDRRSVDVLVPQMDLRYSDGLISALESSPLLGNLGGMNGRAFCLLISAGPCSESGLLWFWDTGVVAVTVGGGGRSRCKLSYRSFLRDKDTEMSILMVHRFTSMFWPMTVSV